MMIGDIFALITIVTAFLLVIGLIRPGFVVWWTDKKSRGSVAAVWGTALVVAALAYMLTRGQQNDPLKSGMRTNTTQQLQG